MQVLINGLDVMKKIKQFISCLLLSLALLSGSAPAQADSINPPATSSLEQQVLQIIRKHPEVILESVQNYQQQQQQQQQQRQQSFIQELKQNPKSIIAQSPTKGATLGKTVLVEFSDFQCPYCAAASGTVKQFVDQHKDQVTLVYKHFPLTSIHDQALPAAKAAWAAQAQGKFWDYHDALFANQKSLGESLYSQIAKNLGLDLNRFNRDRSSAAADRSIAADLQIAETLGLNGTPFFVMNGRAFSGAVDLATLEETLASAK